MTHWLSIKCPNSRPWPSSHRFAVDADSGAGPYSSVSKISATLHPESEGGVG